MQNNNDSLDSLFNKIAAAKLKKYREKAGLSLEEVASKMKIDITRQSLFKYENNLARIKNNIFVEICNVLKLNPDEILNEINSSLILASAVNIGNTNDSIINILDENSKILINPNEILPYEHNENLKYQLLFDKDDRLTAEQKEFFLDMIETQHRKFDEAQEKGNVN